MPCAVPRFVVPSLACVALNGLLCADVPLRANSLTAQSMIHAATVPDSGFVKSDWSQIWPDLTTEVWLEPDL